MRTGGKVRGLWIAVAVIGVFGGALAQEAAPPPADPQAKEAANLTPAQMVAQSKGMMPQLDRSAQTVRRQLSQAREQKDVVKALCLNDKLNQIDLATRTASDRIGGLQAAAAANDQERSKHQYTVILVLKDRVTALVAEANQCIGEETGFIGESNVTVTVEDVPEVDPSAFPDDPLVSEPPVTTPPPPPVVVSTSMPAM